jgi:restriction system protein
VPRERSLTAPSYSRSRRRDWPTAPEVEVHGSTQERIERATQELNESGAAELLGIALDGTPTFFENLVLNLLHAMRYGASRAKLMRVGGSGDGGIDGIISLDKLGLEKFYVQAKRWRDNSVGRPQLQAFFGALAGRKASKGVFITTARFTREAEEFAAAVSDSIVLVDGERLTELMIEHGVRVSHKRYRLAKLDSDYSDG